MNLVQKVNLPCRAWVDVHREALKEEGKKPIVECGGIYGDICFTMNKLQEGELVHDTSIGGRVYVEIREETDPITGTNVAVVAKQPSKQEIAGAMNKFREECSLINSRDKLNYAFQQTLQLLKSYDPDPQDTKYSQKFRAFEDEARQIHSQRLARIVEADRLTGIFNQVRQKIEVRFVEEKDMEEVYRLCFNFYKEWRGTGWASEENSRQWLRQVFAENNQTNKTLVAHLDNKLTASLTYTLGLECSEKKGVYFIECLAFLRDKDFENMYPPGAFGPAFFINSLDFIRGKAFTADTDSQKARDTYGPYGLGIFNIPMRNGSRRRVLGFEIPENI